MIKGDGSFCKVWARQVPNVIAILLTLAVTGAAYLAFFDSNNPRVIETESRDINGLAKKVFKPGETIYVYRRVCVDRVVTGDVDVEISSYIGGTYWFLGTRAVGAAKGCSDRTVLNQLPNNLPDGLYKLRAVGQYNVNPLRTVTYEFPAIDIRIER